jgi:hypothetical protein
MTGSTPRPAGNAEDLAGAVVLERVEQGFDEVPVSVSGRDNLNRF